VACAGSAWAGGVVSRPPKPKPDVAATWEPTASLVPWDKNPRKNDGRPVDELAANMERFGFTAPILARAGTREIIAGHTRWKAATKIGLDRVAVRFLDVTDAEAHAIALADNRLGELAGWDDEMLREVLAELEGASFDLGGLGWTAEELEEVMKEIDPTPLDPDDVPRLDEKNETHTCPTCGGTVYGDRKA
jgi:ParB-like chromosome segregation protein Spo0J